MEQINITLGTAGHIDHGKTALVKLLTGCETDRLKEEKERGMSIELGFAPCKIADLEVGIVDVPGHEHFIKTMVAGATGIDGVILVVAADDGVMPQTREHLDILTLLGIRHGIVALTKIDRAEPAHAEMVREDIERLVRGTFLDGAPILPISNVTGEGFDGFYGGLMNLVKSIKPKSVEGVFRLPVERAFSVKGYGTVVTGIPVSGAVKVGEEVVLLPEGFRGRVNAIQVYAQEGDTAKAGQCAAINVRHWDHAQIGRGDTLAAPGYFEAGEWYVCRLNLLAKDAAVVKNGARVKFHTGTSEVPATVYLFEGERMRPTEEGFVQVKCDGQIVAGPGDKFIVRTLSPVDTIGGGMIVEGVPRKVKRNQAGVLADITERAKAVLDEKAFVEYSVRNAEGVAASVDGVTKRTKVPRRRVETILGELTAAGKAIAVGQGQYAHRDTAARETGRIAALLGEFHKRSPETAGMAVEALVEESGLAKNVFEALAGSMKKEGTTREAGGRVALAGHRPQVSDAERGAIEKVEAAFRAKQFAPPSPAEVEAATGLSKAEVARAIKILKEGGRLVEAPEGILFHGEAIEEARKRIVEFIEREGKLESVKFKYIIDTTRKYAIPLLDYFDRVGVTLRVGNTRYLKGR